MIREEPIEQTIGAGRGKEEVECAIFFFEWARRILTFNHHFGQAWHMR